MSTAVPLHSNRLIHEAITMRHPTEGNDSEIARSTCGSGAEPKDREMKDAWIKEIKGDRRMPEGGRHCLRTKAGGISGSHGGKYEDDSPA
jgi:hypothetical protein